MNRKILIVGAAGQIARLAIPLFLETDDVQVTLYARRASRLKHLVSDRVRVVEGDVLDKRSLQAVMTGHDVVYANLDGQLELLATNIVDAMSQAGLRRLVFVSSMGIYDEVPGEKAGSVLDPYRESAAIIEASDLDYTLVRPAWLDNEDIVAYGLTQKGEAFKAAGATVSRRSVADLVVRLCLTPGLHSRESLGVHRV